MVITEIKGQVHNEKRYSVFVDGEFVFGLSDVDILYYHLEEGQELTQAAYDDILENVVFTKARDQAYHFLSYKPRTAKEMQSKLAEEGYTDEVIEKVMSLLEKYNYINDRQYAMDYIETRNRAKGYGRLRITQEMRERGIDAVLISELLEDAELDEVENALSFLEKKARGNRDLDEKEKRRCVEYLQRRGFSYDVVREAFGLYLDRS